MPRLPALYFDASKLPAEHGFETWRRLMAPMYDIRPQSRAGRPPGGSTIAYVLGDLVANRTLFTAQHVTRDRKRVNTTPDHILFQLWRTGGFTGHVEGRRIACGPGTVTFSDRRRTLDMYFAPADTLGLIVPRHLLAGLDIDTRDVPFDPLRARLLKARLSALCRHVGQTEATAVPALRGELVAFLRRVLDPSTAVDVLEGRELDQGLLALAERTVLARLTDPVLSPDTLAATLGISRATLYRVFAPLGGVMAYVHEQRLLAIRDALADPLERRSLALLAATFGFSTPAYFSRSFRARFGHAPRDWRAQATDRARAQHQAAPERFIHAFENLERSPPRTA